MQTSTGKVHVASALGVYADWLLHDSGPTPEHCGAWQVGIRWIPRKATSRLPCPQSGDTKSTEKGEMTWQNPNGICGKATARALPTATP